MPVYDYACSVCGPFRALRPMADYADPQPCETCGRPAPRAILAAPAIAGLDQNVRRALAINEQARHEPRRSRLSHGSSCGCCRGSGPPAAKSFVGRRPWMISH
jgi:putative FmdB family regulatory protein